MIQAVLHDPELQDYRVLSTTGADGMTFMAPKDAGLAAAYDRVLKSLGSFPGLQWDVPTIDGVLALPLARWAAIYPLVQAEVSRANGAPSYLRLMDILGIRYVSTNSPIAVEHLSLFAQDGPNGLSIYRNDTARPRFQIYAHATFVGSTQDALSELKATRQPLLSLERGFSSTRPRTKRDMACADWNRNQLRIQILEARSMHYRVIADTPCDAWLFLADANYPGWTASVNGVAQPVYTAQVLGKAVHLSAGRNHVQIDYVSRSFYVGAALTSMTFLILVSIGFWVWRTRSAMARQRGRQVSS